jgi:hypothetical protein
VVAGDLAYLDGLTADNGKYGWPGER